MSENKNKRLIEAAKKYLSFGWRVIPTNRKNPCVDYKNLGLHEIYLEKERLPEQKLAFAETFLKLFKEHPEATGIAMIINRDTCVLDLDSQEAINKYQALINESVAIKTYRGIKLLFHSPVHFNLIDAEESLYTMAGSVWKFDLEAHIEILLESHLCELPPSIHPEGIQYEWLKEPDFNDPRYIGITPLPSSLEKAIREHGEYKNKHGGFALGELEEILNGLSEGEGRNDAAYRLACHYIGKGLDWNTLELTITGWNQLNKPPLSQKELSSILNSAKKHYDERHEKGITDNIEEISFEELKKIKQDSDDRRMPKLTDILPLEHFINKVTTWMSGLSDTYYEYQVLAGLWLLSDLIQGKGSVKLRTGEVKPNLYVMLLGQSTKSRKTTAAKKIKQIREIAINEEMYHDEPTLEGYLEILADEPTQSFVCDECSGLLAKFHKKYNEGIFDLECKIFDGESVRKVKASGQKNTVKEFIVKKPYVTHLYATTPDKFCAVMTLEDFLCGYGYRWLYAYPTYKKARMDVDVEDNENVTAWAEVLTAVKTLRKKYTDSSEFTFSITKEALKLFNDIGRELEDEAEKKQDEALDSEVARIEDNILKLSMLLEIGKKEPSHEITEDSIATASLLALDFFLPSFIQLMDRLLSDVKNNKIERAISVIRRMGGTCTRSSLIKNGHFTARECDEIIEALVIGHIVDEKRVHETKGITYILISEAKPLVLQSTEVMGKLNQLREIRNVRKLRNVRNTARNTKTVAKNAKSQKEINTVDGLKEEDQNNSQTGALHFDFSCETANFAKDAKDAKNGDTQITKNPYDVREFFEEGGF